MSKNDICFEQTRTLPLGIFPRHSMRILVKMRKIKKHMRQYKRIIPYAQSLEIKEKGNPIVPKMIMAQ